MKRVRVRLSAIALATCLGASVVAAAGTSAHALSNPTIPVLAFDHTISSHPFSGAAGNASDIEGLASVESDNSMWVTDDNSDSVWEINPSTGAYKARLRGGATKNLDGTPLLAYADFAAATEVGTGLTCGQKLDLAVVGDTAANECLSRTDDFESVVYDGSGALYVTSGIAPSQTLAGTQANPTVWKLTRVGGHFKPTSWRQLPNTEDATAAGWRPGTGLYFGKGTKLKTYNFDTNTLGSPFSIGVSDIVGITFTDASTAFVTTARVDVSAGRTTATSDSTIYRFDASTWTRNVPWTFPLANIGGTAATVDDDGMIDARDTAIIGDKFYVSDGYDGRASDDHPIYVYNLGSAPTPPPGGYILDGWGGLHPFRIGNSGTNPPAVSGGPYWGGWDIARGVAVLPTGTGGYEVDGWGGLHPFRLGSSGINPPTVSGGPYWNGWDIARGVAVLPNGKGGYEVDAYGGIHPFALGGNAAPPAAIGGPYWGGQDMARGISITADGKGGFVSDRTGRLWGFKIDIAGGTAPPPTNGVAIISATSVQGVSIMSDIPPKGGYTVDGWGGTHPFGIGFNLPPQGTSGGPYWLGWDIARDIALMPHS